MSILKKNFSDAHISAETAKLLKAKAFLVTLCELIEEAEADQDFFDELRRLNSAIDKKLIQSIERNISKSQSNAI